MFPKVRIHVDKIRHNATYLKKLCASQGVDIAAVTKVVCGNPDIAKVILDTGVEMLADSRVRNIIRMREAGINAPMMLVRIPMLSQVPELVDHVDYTLISELETVKRIMQAGGKRKTKFIFMVDVGDLREGLWFDDARETLIKAKEMAGDRLVGIGTNLGCFGGVIPSVENNERLLEVARSCPFDFEIISAGNTAALPLIEEGTLPGGINHYRLGESLMLGSDVTGSRSVPGTVNDGFIIDAEVVEYDEKPSIPIGKTGRDAFGGSPEFEDKGIRKRVILAIGGQDVVPDGLYPVDERMEVLHASGDHTIADVTGTNREFKVGDIISFRVSYSALLKAMTSSYVLKEFVV